MEKFIGLDAHLSSCTFAVIGPNGKKLKTNVVETHGEALVEYIRSIRGTKRLCLEEGTMSQWLYELIEPHVAQIVVLVPPQSKGPKSDKSDDRRATNQMHLHWPTSCG